MVGLLQTPEARAPARSVAFVLCRPIGLEGDLTSALFRSLSDRLAREGCSVLRFDYHGTGNSLGDESVQTLAAWSGDLLSAHEALSCAVGHANIHWFGAALGANVALRAAPRARTSPRALVLWEPITEGAAHVERVVNSHRDAVAFGRGMSWGDVRRLGLESDPTLPGWALGFEYGSALVTELRQIRGLALLPAVRRRMTVRCAVPAAERSRVDVPDGDAAVHVELLPTASNWMTRRETGQPLVPPGALRAAVASVC